MMAFGVTERERESLLGHPRVSSDRLTAVRMPRRFSLLPSTIYLLAAACGGEKAAQKPEPAPSQPPVALDTARADLSQLATSLPPAASDAPPPVAAPDPSTIPSIARVPEAPAALMDAVEREEGISRFCYQEFGQKVDQQLRGGVAAVVTVAGGKVVRLRVAADTWSSLAGKGVNACLAEKAPRAWTMPEPVKDGQYVVQMRFRAN